MCTTTAHLKGNLRVRHKTWDLKNIYSSQFDFFFSVKRVLKVLLQNHRKQNIVALRLKKISKLLLSSLGPILWKANTSDKLTTVWNVPKCLNQNILIKIHKTYNVKAVHLHYSLKIIYCFPHLWRHKRNIRVNCTVQSLEVEWNFNFL